MDAKEYLNQIINLEKEVRSRKAEISILKRSLGQLSSPSFGERLIQQNAGDASHVRKLNRIWQREEELKTSESLLERLKDEAEEIISELEDPNERAVLLGKYLEQLTFKQLAERFFITRATACKWAQRAEAKLIIPETSINLEKSNTI